MVKKVKRITLADLKVKKNSKGKVVAFTISKSRWLRYKKNVANPPVSRLLSHNNTMCCLGHYLRACGVSMRTLRSKYGPLAIRLLGKEPAAYVLSEQSEDFLMAEINDNSSLTDAQKQIAIKKEFAKYGIKVSFSS